MNDISFTKSRRKEMGGWNYTRNIQSTTDRNWTPKWKYWHHFSNIPWKTSHHSWPKYNNIRWGIKGIMHIDSESIKKNYITFQTTLFCKLNLRPLQKYRFWGLSRTRTSSNHTGQRKHLKYSFENKRYLEKPWTTSPQQLSTAWQVNHTTLIRRKSNTFYIPTPTLATSERKVIPNAIAWHKAGRWNGHIKIPPKTGPAS